MTHPQLYPDNVPKPGVIPWYRAYCGFMSFLYTGIIIVMVIALFFDFKTELEKEQLPLWAFYIYIGVIFGICAALAGGFITSFFLKPKPWTWIYHLVLISLGLTSPCCMPISIPLLIFWIRPENQTYFGRKTTPATG